MTQESFRELLLAGLDKSAKLRARIVEDPSFGERRAQLRAWQAARLARTHRDLLESRRFREAAKFFLIDLYGPKVLGGRIEEVRRIVPVMLSVLPDAGLATVVHAIELNALSESLDGAMVERLGDRAPEITDTLYGEAYRAVGRADDRDRQIDLIACLGEALDKLTHIPLIGTSLRLMRRPARPAGLSELQGFLERGYAAFGAMRGE